MEPLWSVFQGIENKARTANWIPFLARNWHSDCTFSPVEPGEGGLA